MDIDAQAAGNEGRFVNDFHGTGATPNAQFWPYYDQITGERRMAIKSTALIAAGSSGYDANYQFENLLSELQAAGARMNAICVQRHTAS